MDLFSGGLKKRIRNCRARFYYWEEYVKYYDLFKMYDKYALSPTMFENSSTAVLWAHTETEPRVGVYEQWATALLILELNVRTELSRVIALLLTHAV